MKKTVLVLLAGFLLPAVSFAQYWGYNPLMSESLRGVESNTKQATKKIDEEVYKSVKQKWVSEQGYVKIHDASTYKNKTDEVLLREKIFKHLAQSNPESANEINRIFVIHDQIVQTANSPKLDNATLCQALTYQLEELYEVFTVLKEEAPQVAVQVKILLGHAYAFKPLGGAKKTLDEIKDEILTEFSAYDNQEGKRVGLRIGQDNYKECEAWYDSFDKKD